MDNLRGIGLMTVAMLNFALTDMFIVLASDSLPIGQLIAMLGCFMLAMLIPLAIWRGVPLISRNFLLRPVLLRNAGEMWGTTAVVVALTSLPFALVSAVLQATPLLVTCGAAIFLGAVVGWRRWTAILVGLAGVLVILRPTGSADWTILWAVLAVTGLSVRDLCTRAIPREVPGLQIAVYGVFATIPAGLGVMAVTQEAALPAPGDVALLAAGSVFASVAYVSITFAMRLGEVAVVTPFRYTRLIFAFTIAAVVFGEPPDLATWVGAGIVVATGIYTLLREARTRHRAPPAR